MKRLLLITLLILAQQLRAQTYFPPLVGSDWETTSPADLGWCEDSVQKLIDWLEQTDSKAFIVLKDGRIVLEKYFGSFTEDSFHVWNSAGKTLTAYAVGVAQEAGFLDIDESTSNYLGHWTSLLPEQEEWITIKHQLTMTSGLDDGVPDMFCTDPECLIYKADPGTRWAYHNGPYTLLDSVLEVATGQTMNSWVAQKIGNKIGMFGLYIPVGYNRIFTSKARGMARFGLLLSQNGVWNGTTVLGDATYLQAMITPSQNFNQAYGYLTWLNGQQSYMIPQSQFVFNGSLMPHAPADVYAAEGKDGQIINVSPSTGLVVVRMGGSLGSHLINSTYNDSIWIFMNHLSCSLGLEKEYSLDGITLSPNPFDHFVTISGLQGNEQIEVHDELGRKLKHTFLHGQLEIEDGHTGLYFITIDRDFQRKTFKLVRG